MDLWHGTHEAAGAFGRSVPRRLRCGVSAMVAAGAGAMVLCCLPMAAQATTASKTTFKFSGALSGTLTQANNDCNEVGGNGGMFEFDSNKALLKGSSFKSLTVNVNVLNGKKSGGTYKKFTGLIGNGASIVLDGSTGKQAYYWVTKSGTLTTSATGGSLNVKLGPDTSTFTGKPGKGDITVVGSWGCVADNGS